MRNVYTMRDAHDVVGFAEVSQPVKYAAHIERVYVAPEKRNLGHGSALIRLICRDADRERVQLYIRLDNEEQWLVKLFQRFDFNWNDGIQMIREYRG